MVGVIRRADTVLLVRQQDDNGQPTWSLPAGRVEPGELLQEALVRELREETGLVITDCGRLAWLSQTRLDDPDWGGIWTAIAFDVLDCGGEPACNDPDGLVHEARFVPLEYAYELLAAHASRIMTEPAIMFLQQRAGHGSSWTWRATARFQGEDLLTSYLVAHR